MKLSGSALRSVGRFFEYRKCSTICPPSQICGARSFSPGFENVGIVPVVPKFGSVGERWRGGLREEADLRRTVPSVTLSQLQRRGFLSCGDGDEDSGLSRHFEEDRVIGYSPEQIFAVVAAVDLYEDFVPWCQQSRVLWRKGDVLEAELEIGFKFFVERYISHVELKPPHLIKISFHFNEKRHGEARMSRNSVHVKNKNGLGHDEQTSVSQSNLFDFLNNEWQFKPGPTPGSCHLHFMVDFQFKSPLYRRVANMFFNEVQARLVSSFEERCRAVYGPSMVAAVR